MLTQKRLKEVLHYDPETGDFTWKVNRGGARIGRVCSKGTMNNGYSQIRIDYKPYLAHRLAHLYMEGYFPEHDMDHKFGVRDDNRWAKLSHVSRVCNTQNRVISSRSTSGFPGVGWDGYNNKWRVDIRAQYKSHYLGRYADPLEGALARLTVEVQCPLWTCNHQGALVKAIKAAWPEFNERSLK